MPALLAPSRPGPAPPAHPSHHARRRSHRPLLAATLATVALMAGRRTGVIVAAASSDANAPTPPPPPSWDGTAVVIVDHGSRRDASNRQLDAVVAMYKNLTGRPVVFPAHMEIAPPSIADAVASAVAVGATRVVIAPYFLSDGRHMSEDIPALAAAAAAANASSLPGGVVVGRALGGDEALVRLMESRVVDALGGGGGGGGSGGA